MDKIQFDMPRVNTNIALPSSYDDSLSYYEEVQRFKINLINVITALNNLIDLEASDNNAINNLLVANVQELNNTITQLDNKKENITDLTNNRKLSATGDFTGTLNGLPMSFSEQGLATDVNNAMGTFPTLTAKINNIDSEINDSELKKANVSALFYGLKNDDNISFDSNKNVYNFTYDNKNALQNAFDSGYNITLPKGSYYISSPININKSIKIVGYGAKIYINPINANNSSIFKLLADNVEIEGIEFISQNVFTPKIGNNNVTGLSSNIYALEVCSSNVAIKDCKFTNCFASAYIYGLSDTIKENFSMSNCKAYGTVFGFFCRYYKTISILNCVIEQNTSGLNDFAHHIYIGTCVSNVTIDNVRLGGGTISLYDCISLHDSITAQKNISDIRINNVYCDAVAKSFITLSECSNVIINNCTWNTPKSATQKTIINIQVDSSDVLINNCNFTANVGYSIINYDSNTGNTSNIVVDKCTFNLEDINTFVFRYLGKIEIKRCIFNLTSTSSKVVSIFQNDNNTINYAKNVKLIDCKFFTDVNTKIDKVLITNTTLADLIYIYGCDIYNSSGVNYGTTITDTVALIYIFGSNFYNFNYVYNTSGNPIKNYNNFASGVIS